MKVPFVDLWPQSDQVLTSVMQQIESVIRDSDFILGSRVEKFEKDLGKYLGIEHVIGVANGGDAIEIALRCLELPLGSEVLMPVNTFTATAMATIRAGLTPVFVDVENGTYQMDVEAAARSVTSQTRVVMPVHLYGQIGNMKRVLDFAEKHDLQIIEDAAQSHGATHFGRQMGSFGALTATSFYPGKNLGAFGDAGAVLTTDPVLADRAKRIRNYGGIEKYEHEFFGVNSRLDPIQAVVLIEKLKCLPSWTYQRQTIAAAYLEGLKDCPGVNLPALVPGSEHVWHLFVVQVPNREHVRAELLVRGIQTGIHYPQPLHRQNAFAMLPASDARYPNADEHADRLLSLPIFPGMRQEQCEYVVNTLQEIIPLLS